MLYWRIWLAQNQSTASCNACCPLELHQRSIYRKAKQQLFLSTGLPWNEKQCKGVGDADGFQCMQLLDSQYTRGMQGKAYTISFLEQLISPLAKATPCPTRCGLTALSCT